MQLALPRAHDSRYRFGFPLEYEVHRLWPGSMTSDSYYGIGV
jgi:hypothetical protein